MRTSLFLFAIAFLAFGFAFVAHAAVNPFNIVFPIPELGNCSDLNACKTYCDDAVHFDACTQFGKAHGLVSDQDIKKGKQELSQQKDIDRELSQGGGPGDCKSRDECKTYCQDSSHLQECLDFGQKHGLISQDDATRIKKSGFAGGPGGCKGSECRTYCNDPSHQKECFQFAKDNGLISKDEADRAEKFMRVSEQGGPGGCKGEECKTYCNDQSHQKECFQFAKDHDLISSEDEEDFQVGEKLKDTIEKTGGPGGCKSEDECRSYCTNPSHVEECVAFASTHAGISQDKAKQMLQDFTEQKFQGQGEFTSQKQIEQFKQESEQKFRQFKQLEEKFRGQGWQGQLPPQMKQMNEQFQRKPQELQEVPHPSNSVPDQNQEKVVACEDEGGVWDGSTCGPPKESDQFFPDEGEILNNINVDQQQLKQQILQQQIQEQTKQLQELQQMRQMQTAPLPPPPTGGSILDALLKFLRL